MNDILSSCKLCPRKCGVNRHEAVGVCGSTSVIRAAKAQLHHWEEPCISGSRGSGAIFFSGCTLKCCFCQNNTISNQNNGKEISVERLSEIFLELQEKGAHNINLVNPTHFVPQIIKALDAVKHRLNIPVVYNSGGYERRETLKELMGYIDIYLPDFKYVSHDISSRYSKAPDYFECATEALLEMHRQQPKLVWREKMLEKGLIIRHLILPSHRHDSIAVVEHLAGLLPKESFLLSLMSQYTPVGTLDAYPELKRRVSTFEYNSVLDVVEKHGLNGFSQERSSAVSNYTPEFNFEGL